MEFHPKVFIVPCVHSTSLNMSAYLRHRHSRSALARLDRVPLGDFVFAYRLDD